MQCLLQRRFDLRTRSKVRRSRTLTRLSRLTTLQTLTSLATLKGFYRRALLQKSKTLNKPLGTILIALLQSFLFPIRNVLYFKTVIASKVSFVGDLFDFVLLAPYWLKLIHKTALSSRLIC